MRGNDFRSSGGDHAAVIGVPEYRHAEASCFADDVVVDFPSMASAVDRMRRAFVADERGEALSAAIQISSREALAGASVPLDVPVRCTCHSCGGRGETWTESCRNCRGTGVELRRHQVHVLVPAGVSDGTRVCFTVTPRHNPPTRIELLVNVA